MLEMFLITAKWYRDLKMGEAVEYSQTMECINTLLLLWATRIGHGGHLSHTVQSIHCIVHVEKWSMEYADLRLNSLFGNLLIYYASMLSS